MGNCCMGVNGRREHLLYERCVGVVFLREEGYTLLVRFDNAQPQVNCAPNYIFQSRYMHFSYFSTALSQSDFAKQ